MKKPSSSSYAIFYTKVSECLPNFYKKVNENTKKYKIFNFKPNGMKSVFREWFVLR